MRDRQVYWALGATLALFVWLIITMLFYIPSPAKVIITVILTIVCVGVVFASVVLMNLKRNPKAYNWMDPDLKLTRLEEKKKSKDGYYYYDFKKRKLIVEEYRQLRDQGLITNKDAWAKTNHKISGKTLKEYEDEFPREETGRE